MLSPEEARKISLIEILWESAAERFPHASISAPSEQDALSWSEDQIRGYFNQQLAKAAAATEAAAAGGNDGVITPTSVGNGCGRSNGLHGFLLPAVASSLPVAADHPALLARWFPGLKLSGTAHPNPRLRVFAFHSAGNAEDMWTSEGTGGRRSPSPLLEWCRATGVELLAVQLPGRGSRSREPFLTSAQDVARELLPVTAPLLASGVPYVVLSHSFGGWVCFEWVRAVRAAGLPLPAAWCLSAMPAPDWPEGARPWRRQRTLGFEDFKEEMREWDVNEVVFSHDMWQIYEPILRADCIVFDEYETAAAPCGGSQQAELCGPPGLVDPDDVSRTLPREPLDVQPFEFPITAFWGTHDRRVKSAHVAAWSRFTRGPFRLLPVAGNHLWPVNNKEAKSEWLKHVVLAFEEACGGGGGGDGGSSWPA